MLALVVKHQLALLSINSKLISKEFISYFRLVNGGALQLNQALHPMIPDMTYKKFHEPDTCMPFRVVNQVKDRPK